MKGKKEDDNGKPKSTNESMRVNHFADLLVHVELEQLSNCSRFQSKPVKEWAPTDVVTVAWFTKFLPFEGMCLIFVFYDLRSTHFR